MKTNRLMPPRVAGHSLRYITLDRGNGGRYTSRYVCGCGDVGHAMGSMKAAAKQFDAHVAAAAEVQTQAA